MTPGEKNLSPLGITYINTVYKNQPLGINRNIKSVAPKFSTPPKLPPTPRMAPHENFANKKLTPKDYIYKHCV